MRSLGSFLPFERGKGLVHETVHSHGPQDEEAGKNINAPMAIANVMNLRFATSVELCFR